MSGGTRFEDGPKMTAKWRETVILAFSALLRTNMEECFLWEAGSGIILKSIIFIEWRFYVQPECRMGQ